MMLYQGGIRCVHAATAWWAEQGPCEPMGAWESLRENQSKPGLVRVSQNVPEWAKESQSESESARVSMHYNKFKKWGSLVAKH